MTSLLLADTLASDVTTAEVQMTRHQEYRAEIDTREKVVNDFQLTAEKLVADGHNALSDIEEKIQRLQKAWHALQETWQDRFFELEQNKEVQLFRRDADQLEAWINARENDVLCEDVGDSLDAVEELLKKQEEFEKMLLTQERKFLGLSKLTQHEVDVVRRTNDERMQEFEDAEKKRRRELENEEWQKTETKELERREVERQREEERRELERRDEERKEREEFERRKREERIRREEEEKARKEIEQRERKQKEEEANRQKLEEQEKIQQRISERRIQWQQRESLDRNSNIADDSLDIMCEGFLQRKQEYEAGARKTHSRGWKTFYTGLRGTEPELVFFKEKKDVPLRTFAAPPMDLSGAWCEEARDYTKRKHVFRLVSPDDAEFLFVARNSSDLCRWVQQITMVTGQLDGTSSPPSPEVPSLEEETRLRSPLITLTSVDNEDQPVAFDEYSLPEPLDIPPPVIPQDSEEEFPDELELPDASQVPEVPDILPPEVTPFDFSDMEGSVDYGDESFEDEDDGGGVPPQLPTSPPPPLHPATRNGCERAPSPPAYTPTQFEDPKLPPRVKRKVPPPVAPKPATRERSGTQDSCSSSDSSGPRPPVKPKPVGLRSAAAGAQNPADPPERASASKWREMHAQDDRKQEKKKGMFGNIFKKRDKK